MYYNRRSQTTEGSVSDFTTTSTTFASATHPSTITTSTPSTSERSSILVSAIKNIIFNATDLDNQDLSEEQSEFEEIENLPETAKMDWIKQTGASVADKLSSFKESVVAPTPEEVVTAMTEVVREASTDITWEEVVSGIIFAFLALLSIHRLVMRVYRMAFEKVLAEQIEGTFFLLLV